MREWREKTADDDALNFWRQFSYKKIRTQKFHKRKACSTFPVLERKDKGRKRCLLLAKMA